MESRLVYVIDDDSAVLRSTAFLLQSLGYTVDCYEQPQEFLSAVGHLERGCVITDLRMPTLSGFELRRAMQAQAISWPVVLMTSEQPPADVSSPPDAFCGLLRKPFTTEELIAVLDECFAALERASAPGTEQLD